MSVVLFDHGGKECFGRPEMTLRVHRHCQSVKYYGCYNLSVTQKRRANRFPFFPPSSVIICLASVDKNIAHRFSFLFLSHRSLEALLIVSAVHLSVSRPSVCLNRHFFASFHIIRDVFLFIFTSFVMYFRPFHITFFIALPPLSIYNFTSNNHSLFFYLF